MAKNLTSENEQRVRSLFLLLRVLFNDALSSSGLPNSIPEASDEEHGIVFHFGNKGTLFHSLRGNAIYAPKGGGFVLVEGSKPENGDKVAGGRKCFTCYLSSMISDDVVALGVMGRAMTDQARRINVGTEVDGIDDFDGIIEDLPAKVGFTKGGKPSAELLKRLEPALAKLGKWPLPGTGVKVKVKKDTQGSRGPVRAYCTGILNPPDADGNLVPCKVENERHEPTDYYQPFHPATAEEQIKIHNDNLGSPGCGCHFCDGPIMTKKQQTEARKNRTEEVEIVIS